MGYQDKELLRDKRQNPIPQEFDPVSDSFKPLTVREFYGYKTDIKPTVGIEKGSTFLEFDGDAYIFTGSSWVVL